MGFFDKLKKNNDDNQGIVLLTKHQNKEIDDSQFLRQFGKISVFYSTPFGDHKDGGKRVFLLPGPDKTGFLPVFTSVEKISAFYEEAGRVGYAIMEGNFTDVLNTTKEVNKSAPIKMGVIIDPGYFDVTVDATMLDTVIEMTK